jgi:diguanylate cyclase (GGDEF)-like protein
MVLNPSTLGRAGLGRQPVPLRAIVISAFALFVPAVATLAFSEQLRYNEVLVWLVALIPAFLVAYYRGWEGVAKALALGMVVLTAVQIILLLQGRRVLHHEMLATVVGAYVIIGVGVGLLTELIHRERERAVEMALTDGLTQLPNRRFAELALEREFAAARRGRRLCVVMFDLDGFKRFNDTHGHPGGDEALKTFAEALDGVTRKMDLSCRWGGEEFLSIVSSSGLEGALVFVSRVKERLATVQVRGETVSVGVGLAEYGSRYATAGALIEAADNAMYRAKARGPGSVAAVYGNDPEDLDAEGHRERRAGPSDRRAIQREPAST